MNFLATWLHLDNRTWHTIPYQGLTGRMLTVLFAYTILAWNRFGLVAFSSPRIPLRLLLVGIYSWLALAVLLWGVSRWVGDRTPSTHEAAVAAAILQVPIVTLGFIMAIVAGFARILGPSLVVAVLVFALWVPALLARAFREVAGLSWPATVVAVVATHLTWLVLPGRFFFDQVGHLL